MSWKSSGAFLHCQDNKLSIPQFAAPRKIATKIASTKAVQGLFTHRGNAHLEFSKRIYAFIVYAAVFALNIHPRLYILSTFPLFEAMYIPAYECGSCTCRLPSAITRMLHAAGML